MGSEKTPFGMSLSQLREAYRSGTTTPTKVLADVMGQIEQTRDNHAWICVANLAKVMEQAARLEAALAAGEFEDLPLYGVPLAVKDNIDVAGFPTTNACPDF